MSESPRQVRGAAQPAGIAVDGSRAHCPSETLIVRFLGRSLPPRDLDRIESHLPNCPGCRKLVAELARVNTGALNEAPANFGNSEPLAVESVIADRYRILRMVGVGGMGEVYEAEDLELDCHVALKMLSRTNHSEHAERLFRREIQMARQINHPSVCRVYDMGFEPRPGENVPRISFITMEFVNGVTLRQHLRAQGPMTVAQAMPLLRQIVSALEAIHAVGIIHRDLKSSNVLLEQTEAGLRAVIIDFGLARPISRAEGSHHTLAGAFAGTPTHMAPEQVEGRETDVRTDIYALGVVMFELCTGHLPFDDANPLVAALDRLRRPAPSPRQHVPTLDLRWEQAILRCLQVDPTERFQSVRAVLEAVDGDSNPVSAVSFPSAVDPRAAAISQQLPATAPEAKSRSVLPWVVASLTTALAAFIAIDVFLGGGHHGPPPWVPADEEPKLVKTKPADSAPTEHRLVVTPVASASPAAAVPAADPVASAAPKRAAETPQKKAARQPKATAVSRRPAKRRKDTTEVDSPSTARPQRASHADDEILLPAD